MLPFLSRLALLVTCLGAVGCSSFGETFLFVAHSEDRTRHQYYRVTISGFSLLASSNYAAGVYDANAVDALFGELDGGRFRIKPEESVDTTLPPGPVTNGDQHDSSAQTANLEISTLDGKKMRDSRLVLFLSSNADSLINRIKSFATTEQVTTNLTQILLKEEIQAVETAKAVVPRQNARAETLATELRAIAKQAEAADINGISSDDLREWLRSALQSTAAVGQPGVQFTSLDQARTWFNENRAVLQEGVGR
ncbi:MAG: hypothetical protein AAF581_07740 [Planctomycetota bacterium]